MKIAHDIERWRHGRRCGKGQHTRLETDHIARQQCTCGLSFIFADITAYQHDPTAAALFFHCVEDVVVVLDRNVLHAADCTRYRNSTCSCGLTTFITTYFPNLMFLDLYYFTIPAVRNHYLHQFLL